MATNKRLIKSNDEAAGTFSFNTVLYTANGGTLPVTGVGFQPDLVWVKSRVDAQQHLLTDSVRGVGNGLISNLTLSEAGVSSNANGKVQSFDIDGFTVNIGTNNQPTNNYTNDTSNGGDYVAWCWKAGGTAVTNTDGTITSQVSAAAGFSVVKYTGNSQSGPTVGHGLGQKPDLILVKNLSVAQDWAVYSSPTTANKYLMLNKTNAAIDYQHIFNDTEPDSSVFTLGYQGRVNQSGNQYVAYCFSSITGSQKVGSYTGGGTTKRIYTTDDGTSSGTGGFKPTFVMIKCTSSLGANQEYASWVMHDNLRNIESSDRVTDPLFANRTYQEGLRGNGGAGAGVLDLTFESDGFTIEHNGYEENSASATYIYLAIKAN